MLKEELWTRQQTTAELILLRRSQVVEETTLLEEIWRNGTREQEVIKELEKDKEQAWEDDRIVYIEEKSMFWIIRRYKSKSYKKITIQQI